MNNKAELERQAKSDADKSEREVIRSARSVNYGFVCSAAIKVTAAFAGPFVLTATQRSALANLTLQIRQLDTFIKAAKEHDGIAPYMIGKDGMLLDQYKTTNDKKESI